MATKDEERKALEKIRKIVDGLGEGSYLSMAFEGCFSDAVENIENDWGCSWKQRAESAINDLNNCRNANAVLNGELGEAKAEIVRLAEEVEMKSKLALSADDLSDVRRLVENVIYEESCKRSEAAQKIVQYADHPEADEFRQSVLDHRAAQRRIEYHQALESRIVDVLTLSLGN